MKDCTCRVTGPAYGQTRWDPKCSFHGDGGSMVGVIVLKRKTPHRASDAASTFPTVTNENGKRIERG